MEELLGEFLRKKRKKRGLTQQQVAEELGIFKSRWSEIERSKGAPLSNSSNEFKQSVCRVLGIKLPELKRRIASQSNMHARARYRTMIGGFITNLRLKHGLTQEELAEKARISVQTLSRIESGKTKTRPHEGTLNSLADALNCDRAVMQRHTIKRTRR